MGPSKTIVTNQAGTTLEPPGNTVDDKILHDLTYQP